MLKQRTAARWCAGLLMAGAVVVGGVVAPAQADTGWNGTIAPAQSQHMKPADTGWNGT